MSKRLHPKRLARMMASALFFFPQHPPEAWVIEKVGPYWVFKLHGEGVGHKPAQQIRIRPGQLNRKTG